MVLKGRFEKLHKEVVPLGRRRRYEERLKAYEKII
jgi:hypothetical protein